MLMKARMLVTTARAMSRLDSTSVSILRCKIGFLFEGWLFGRRTFWGNSKPMHLLREIRRRNSETDLEVPSRNASYNWLVV